jgi:hypothetical protein
VAEPVVGRRLVAGGLGLTIFGAALLAGWADIGRSLDVLVGRSAPAGASFALVATLCWAATATVIASVAGVMLRGALDDQRPHARPQRWLRASLLVVVGAAVLGLGISRSLGGYRVCCATPAAVQEAERLAR